MKTKLSLFSFAISAILNLITGILLIFFFKNIIFIAVAQLIGYFSAFIFLTRATRNYLRIDYNIFVILKSIFASVLMGLFSYSIFKYNSSTWFIMGVVIPASALLYFGLMFIFKAFSKNEINVVLNFLHIRAKG